MFRTRPIHLFRGFAQLDPALAEDLAPLSRPRARGADIFEALHIDQRGANAPGD